MHQTNCATPIVDHEELDSTNSQAKRLVEGGRGGRFVVSAARQTAGRGRFRRAWHAPANNVAMTIAVPREAGWRDFQTLSLMTGLAIHDVLSGLIGERAAVRIKWPNDIVVDDAKISGTLIESDAQRIYAGIGINLAAEPEGVIYPTTSLARFCAVGRLALIGMVADSWLARFDRWTRDGFAPIAAAYTERIWRRTSTIGIALDEARTQRVEGVCLGVDPAGLLRIELPDGEVRVFSAGDVGA
ncbi:biotin--[acetyl-CoA-carboxylase] ligase [Ramlibacter sp.]|uniref:biotin--[acetyl-CoA-carboxylase] ligase n=1 Tax=Ramlibacter sp. TaxID=1917967 RepID=UPI00180613EB|nr:biotin--[acetyl-CoA-carboxylase] ligase [Ramlibacter sp.]MBA2673884.1 biotin--[acetyl-CoA-carboxylase] ligase [Ramlibacter sp.]